MCGNYIYRMETCKFSPQKHTDSHACKCGGIHVLLKKREIWDHLYFNPKQGNLKANDILPSLIL
jgi:hypothetical protein